MRHRLAIFFLILLIFVVIAFFYIHTIFLPYQLKQIITGKVSAYLGRDLTVGPVHYNLVKGAVIKDLTIYRKDEKRFPFVHVDEVRFSILIPALFKDQKIIIPSLTVTNPFIHIIRTGDTTWNFSDLLAKRSQTGKRKALPFLIGSITVEQGRILLTDKGVDPVKTAVFEEIHLKASLSLKKGVTYELETRIPEKSSLIKTTGNYDLLSKKLTTQISVQKLNLSPYLPLFSKNKDIALKEAFIESGEADLLLKKEEGRIIVNGNVFMHNSVFHFREDKQLSGTVTLKDAAYSRQDGMMNLSGRLEVTDAVFNFAGDKHLKGNITAQDAAVTIVNNKRTIKGHVKTKEIVFYSGDDKKFEIPDITGKLRYADDTITWEDLEGIFKDTKYILNGQLTNPSRPIVETHVRSPHLDMSAKIKILRQALGIPSLTGKYYNSSFGIKGDVHFNENSRPAGRSASGGGKAGGPVVDLRIQIDLALADLSRFGPVVKEKLKAVKPTGILPMNATFTGTVQDWKNAAISLSSDAADITLAGYKLNDFSVKLEPGDQDTTAFTITGSLYDGKFSLTSLLNLKQDDIPFKMSARLKDTNLEKLKKDSRFKERDITGFLSLALNLSGPIKKISAIHGDGTLVIRDGHLWEFNLLKGIWGILLIPELEDIVFTAISTKFTIENKRATTDDLLLKSRPVDILGEGWIDLDRNIAFSVTPELKKSTLIDSESVKKAPTAILAQIAGSTSIRISGTLSNPKFEKVIHPLKILKKTTGAVEKATKGILNEVPDILKNSVKEILEGIFQ